MIHFLNLSVASKEPTVRKYPNEKFGDQPSEHRWRAWWSKEGTDVIGIELRCYPVTKLTEQGAWIDASAWLQHGTHGLEWVKNHDAARWVSNTGGAAWAKSTQEEALRSLALRYHRWSQRIINDADFFVQASKILPALLPQYAKFSRDGLGAFSDFVAVNTSKQEVA